ncbi:MAG TPA: formylglycine-generating enzyme family protein [Verrucomicrobiae bacterium]
MKQLRYFSLLCWAIWAWEPRSSAQTPPVLNVQVYPGLRITGTVGTVYSIQYVTDLAQTNNASAWRGLEFLRLPASPYLWTDTSAPATGRRFYRAMVIPISTNNMAFIPPGSFRMGSPIDEAGRYDWEGPQTEVTISRGFYMGKREVTQAEYLAVTGTNPSWFQPPNATSDLSRPVEQVTWFEATNYCGLITQRDRALGRISTNTVYRLPTEAEWEYACRGWTSTRFSLGDDPNYASLTNYVWYAGNAESTTHPVGQKLPNPWGLFDMHGNVWEWCQGWGDYYYPGGIALDPQGPLAGSTRAHRGGGWGSPAPDCRSANRGNSNPGDRATTTGFRVVLAPGEP